MAWCPIVLGLLANIVVSGTAAAIGTFLWDGKWPGTPVSLNDWPVAIPTYRFEPYVTRSGHWWGDDYGAMYVPKVIPYQADRLVTVLATGIPARAFLAKREIDCDVEKNLSTVRWSWCAASNQRVIIPLRPAWPGFIINTLFYATLAFAFSRLPRALRRHHRRRTNRCPTCGYPRTDLPPTAPCPECGTAPTPR